MIRSKKALLIVAILAVGVPVIGGQRYISGIVWPAQAPGMVGR